MNDRLDNFPLARALSLRLRRIIYQNITIALGTVVVMTCAAFSFSDPAGHRRCCHEGSTVIVILNSLWLLFVGAA